MSVLICVREAHETESAIWDTVRNSIALVITYVWCHEFRDDEVISISEREINTRPRWKKHLADLDYEGSNCRKKGEKECLQIEVLF